MRSEHQRMPGRQMRNSVIRNEIGFHRVQVALLSSDGKCVAERYDQKGLDVQVRHLRAGLR
jgi:hypothetical protein